MIGIPSIDSFIGGGLPVGGVCLIGQDRDNNYADIVNRCFIAEGITHKHSIYVANLNETKESLFQVKLNFYSLMQSPFFKLSRIIRNTLFSVKQYSKK